MADRMFVANVGDSKGRLFARTEQGFEIIKLNQTHNAEKKKEQEQLTMKFPDDKDIVVCKRPGNKVCYVKGRLQPTRVPIF
jgi:hypothetical protein